MFRDSGSRAPLRRVLVVLLAALGLVLGLVSMPTALAAAAPAATKPVPSTGKPAAARKSTPPALPPGTRQLQEDTQSPQQQAAMDVAAQTAHRTGKATPIPALTTETQTVTAQPKGGFLLSETPTPARTMQRGTWVPIDTTLHEQSDGTLTPSATAFGSVRFSHGGSGPLVTTTSGATTYTLSWPGALPRPVVSGSTVTYRDVFPGVDLELAATSSGGFSDVLVVHTAVAAKNPALVALTLASKVSGGQVQTSGQVPLTVTDPHSGRTLQASGALMWDSNTTVPSSPAPTKPRSATNHDSTTPVAPEPSDAGHPGGAARIGVVGVRASASALRLTPDKKLLTASDTKFPVYIDPTFTWHNAPHTTFGYDEVKQGAPCNHVSDFDNASVDVADSGFLGVGYNGFAGSGCIGDEHTYYQWQMPTVLKGATINSASVGVTKVYAATCGLSTTVNLTWTGGIGPATDWNNRPGGASPAYSTSTAIGGAENPTRCAGASDSVGSFNVTTPIRQSVSGHAGGFTVMLSENSLEAAHSDGGFSRFSSGSFGTPLPTLSIQYDHAPGVPTNQAMSIGGAPINCATTQPYPLVGKSLKVSPPVLMAKVTDPDGDLLQANFQYWLDGSTTKQSGNSADDLNNGAKAQLSVSPSWVSTNLTTNGTVVDWQVKATDGELSSALSPVCHFIAEPNAPDSPTIKSADGTYPSVDTGGTQGGHAGVAGSFSLSTHSSSASKFLYSLDQPPSTTNPLSSQVVSSASFTGGAAEGKLADRWLLHDGTGSTGADSVGANPVTASPTGTSWTTDATHGTVLTLDGSSGYAAAAHPVIDTASSYTVSAWVNLANTTGFHTAVSVGGTARGAFYLQYSSSAGAWSFVSPSEDTSGNVPSFAAATAATAPTLNAWNQLVGVFDSTNGNMTLYVNGVQAGTAVNPSPWVGTGPLTIGSVKLASGAVDSANFFAGSVSDVQVYSRALSKTDVTALFNPGTPATGTLADRYKLTDGTGSTAADLAGSNTATLVNTAWTDDPQRGTVLALNGTSAYGATAGPVVDTSGSYSVSAWVKLNNTNGFATAVSETGTNMGAFYLQYNHTSNTWSFVQTAGDSTTALQSAARSTTAPVLNTWTHLVGTYDVSTHAMSLYVNGVLAGTATNATPWAATGPLTIGDLKMANGVVNSGNFFPGSISDVQVYNRALTASDVSGMFTTATVSITPPSPGPHTLYAYAVDPAGNVSGQAVYNFLVATDATAGVTCDSLAACDNNTAISDNADPSLGAYAATSASALNTASNYSVSALVKLNNLGNAATAVSQGGANVASFYLQYSATANAWAFVSPASDSATAADVSAHGSVPPALNAWTHLVGVYNVSTHAMALYVNGVLTSTATDSTPWNGTGPLAIGAVTPTKVAGSNYFPGSISDVQTYARALTAAEVATIYGGGTATTPANHWSLSDSAANGDTGTAAADLAGGKTAVFNGGATWAADPTRGKVLSLSGPGGADGVNTLSAEDLATAGWTSGGSVNVDGASFTLPNFGHGQNDNVLAGGQTVTYNQALSSTGTSQLVFLTTATNTATLPDKTFTAPSLDGPLTPAAPAVPAGFPVAGSYCFDSLNPANFCPSQGQINYTEGSPTMFSLTVPDWVSGPASLAAVALPHRNGPSGQTSFGAGAGPKLYTFSVPLLPGRTIKSITLPDVGTQAAFGNETLHIFGMSTRDTTQAALASSPTTTQSWTGAWGSPSEGDYDFADATGFAAQTFRVAVKPSVSGSDVRIKLDNALGNGPLDIGAASIALSSNPNAPSPNAATTPVPLSFRGSAGVTIPTGGMAYSDPLPFDVTANQYVLVSFYLHNGDGVQGSDPALPNLPEHTFADTGWEYVAPANTHDLTASASSTFFNGTNGPFTNVLTDLDVTAPSKNVPTTAVLGDGLIDPFETNADALSQVDVAADLAADEPSFPTSFGTIAEGIEANQIMADDRETDQGASVGGPSALARLDRDILDQPNLTTVVVDEGLEDLLYGADPTALELDGYQNLIAELSAAGVTVVDIPVQPCDGYVGGGGMPNDPCTATVNTNRDTVNSWLTSGNTLNSFQTPPFFYADIDNLGDPALASAAAMPDKVNLSAAGYGAVTTDYLGPLDTWLLDNDGTDPTLAPDTALDSTNLNLAANQFAGQNDLTLAGGATYQADTDSSSRGTVLGLDGSTGFAATSGPALTTTGSFTVSAWVHLASLPTQDGDVISQDATTNSAFALQYDATDQRWAFGLSAADNAEGTALVKAKSQFAPTTGNTGGWTHLVGVYNANAGSLSLYVNGAPNGTATDTTPFASSGVLAVGRGQVNGSPTAFFPGEISDAQTWTYAMSPSQIGALFEGIS